MSDPERKPDRDRGQGITMVGEFDPPISIRNGVPPEASDPPGGVPRRPDPETRPHPAPSQDRPEPDVTLPVDQPPMVPPRREAHEHRNRHHGQR